MASGADALVALGGKAARAKGRPSLLGFDVSVEDFIDAHPEMSPEDASKVRRANLFRHASISPRCAAPHKGSAGTIRPGF